MSLGNDVVMFFRSMRGRGSESGDSPTDERQLISRDEVVILYSLILGREPESEEVINEKRRSGSASDVGFGMLMSEEFITRNMSVIRRMIL